MNSSFLFCLTLAMQLAGALILLRGAVRNIKGQVHAHCFSGSNFVEYDKNEKCMISKERLWKSADIVYRNIAAFINLSCGYLLAVFGFYSEWKWYHNAVCVIALTRFIMVIEEQIVAFIARKQYPRDLPLSDAEVNTLGADAFATSKDIDDLLNN